MSDVFGAGVTYLSPEAFDKLLEAIDNPKPPTQGLIDLMRRVPPWGEASGFYDDR